MTTKITEQNISQLANAGVNWQSVNYRQMVQQV
jgi:hypothetical protein